MDITRVIEIEINNILNQEIEISNESKLEDLGLDSLDKVQIMLQLEGFFNVNLEKLNLEDKFLKSESVLDMVLIINDAISKK